MSSGVSRPALALEWIEGVSWTLAIERRDDGLAELRQLAHALVAARRAGLDRHGDLEPEDTFLEPSGKVRVLDPSSRASASDDRMLATEFYNPMLERTDLPALGLLLVEAVTGAQAMLLDAGDRPVRSLGPELGRRLDAARAVSFGSGRERLLRMPLPIALARLGLRRDGPGLEAAGAPDVASLAASLDRIV